MKCIVILLLICIMGISVDAQRTKVLHLEKGEKWFGGAVNEGHYMPFKEGYTINLYGDNKGNQAAPIFLSTTGRFIWSEEPFEFSIKKGEVIVSKIVGKIEFGRGGANTCPRFQEGQYPILPFGGKTP